MNHKFKLSISCILIFTILFSSFPILTFAAVPTTAELNGIKALRTAHGYSYITDDVILAVSSKLKNDGVSLVTNRTINGSFKYFNIGVYDKYNLIVYGEKHNKSGEKPDEFGEYRFLGWDVAGNEVTNDLFQNDADSSIDLTKKNWLKVDLYTDSWNINAKYQEQIDQILTIKPIMNDGDSINLSISDILSERTNSNNIKQYVHVMVGSKLTSAGTVQLKHTTNNGTKTWYDSFTIPSLVKNFKEPTVTIAAKPGTYIISENAAEITVPIDVTADFTMNIPFGKTPAQIIQIDSSKIGMARLSYEGANKESSIIGSKAVATYNKTFKRNELNIGINKVPITGYLDYAESIYGDQWKGLAANNTVTIEVIDPSEPYAEITVTANPDSIKYVGEDIPIKVSTSAALQGYTNISNIKEVVFYAKFDDDPPELFQKKTLSAALSASSTFDFLIPKTRVTGDSFNQKFKVTVIFNYKTPVNNKANATATDYADTSIYKEDPPPPSEGGNLRPKAILHSPKQVKAGDPAHLDGSDSYDEDGMIAYYIFNTPGTTAPILWSNAGSVYYPEEGTYDIDFMVIDDAGARDSVERTIKVLPPTPEAKAKITGTLKENRKITIDASGSTSPQLYPMVWANTTWSLSASGNSISHIKYSGVLNGSKTKDILVKKAGTDRIDIKVINTKGYSDTAYNTLTIVPDKPPIADFSTLTTVFRNPEDTNYSLITVNDTSYSTDNDYIKNCILAVSYDSDNNGAFNNGSIQIDAAAFTNGQTKLVATPWGFDVPVTVYKLANKPIQFDIKTKHVGKYFVDLKAIEGFGQETIAAFITEADYRTDDTTDKPNIEKIVEVLNLAPVAGFNMTHKRKADIVIGLPDNYTQAEINSQINSKVIPGLVSNNMSYDLRYVSYEAYKPQPIDNFYYFAFSSGDDNALKIFKFDYATGLVDSAGAGLNNSSPELFITNANKAWLIVDNYHYLGDGKSTSFDSVARYDGNNGFAATTVFSAYEDAKTNKHGPITNVTVNKEGTIFWTYKNVRYGCTVNGSYFTVGSNTYDQGKPYTEWVATSPTEVTYTIENTTINGKAAKQVVGTKEGIKTILHKERTTGSYEYVRVGKYYPQSEMNTIDKAFNSIIWKNDYERYFVPLSSNVMTELDKKDIISNLVSNSLAKNVTIVALGNSLNKTPFEGLLEKNDGNGIYTDLTNLSAAFTKLGDYILNRIYVDLVFNLGQSAHTLDEIKAKVNSLLRTKLAAGNVSASISYISSAADMNSALSNTLWNPMKDHMFIHVQDSLIADLNNSAKRTSILAALRGNEVGVIGLGRNTNSTQINSLILSNESEGTFIDNTNIDPAMNSLGNYVVANAKRKTPNVYKYLTLGEDVHYNTTYSDIENDPVYSERWKFTHSETYFENNLGRISDSGIYKVSPYQIFTKTGKYEIVYAARDNPKNNIQFDNYRLWSNEDLSKLTLLVHRKPIASYLWSITKAGSTYNLVITDTSEDFDHKSRSDKGIVQRLWKWKLPTDTEWKTGTPSTLQIGNTYLVQLMVQDIEGAWSEPYIQEISVPNIMVDAIPPFRDWANTNVNVNVVATIIGNVLFDRVEYKWTNDTIKPASGWTSSAVSNFNITQTNNGEWYLHLVAHDNWDNSYYLYRGAYRIDKIAPTIAADITSSGSVQSVSVNVTVADTGGSGIKEVKYKWSKSPTKPSSGLSTTGGSFSTTIDQEGIWYLHVEATDNAGNGTYKYFGAYEVDSYKLENFRVVMVRDLHLETYYYNALTGEYIDIPMYVNKLALDDISFEGMVDGLTKGYKFEFEIDSRNFNENVDTIMIEPHFYTTDGFARDDEERDLYWEDSNHKISKAGESGHSSWKSIILDASDRNIRNDIEATWRGEYLIPGSAWAVPKGTAAVQAKTKNLKRDIIVNFHIKGYKDGELKFDYNEEQWAIERTVNKYPYIIGDVIRYSWDKNCLNDIKAKDNR